MPLCQGKDAVAIVDFYLKKKKHVDGVDAATIARLMQGKSCAELETLINEAGLYAGFERAPSITMDHFIKAVMRTIINIPYDDYDDDHDDDYYDDYDCEYDDCDSRSNYANEYSHIVYHEAGHIVVSEILCPQSVTLAAAFDKDGKRCGITKLFDEGGYVLGHWHKSHIVSALGGMAAIDRKFGRFGTGCERDLEQAFSGARELVENLGASGLQLHGSGYPSESLKAQIESAVAAEVERCYAKAKNILWKNEEFYNKIAAELGEKGVLTAIDIQRIRETCAIWLEFDFY